MLIQTLFDPGQTVWVKQADGKIVRRRIWSVIVTSKSRSVKGSDGYLPPVVTYGVSSRSPWVAYAVTEDRVYRTKEEAEAVLRGREVGE